MVRVCLLGRLELAADDGPLELPARAPARTLLAWLALHPGRHARSTVAGTLWPHVREDSARVSLRTALSALRVALGPAAEEALEATRQHVALAGAPYVWVDAREFDRLQTSDPALAITLCRGPLLEGYDDDWVLTARDAQRDRESQVLRALADAADPATAVALARRRAALDPFDEPASRDLMRHLVTTGDRAGALASYERLATRLRRELGVPPSATTRALAAELRTGGNAVDPAVTRIHRPPVPAPLALARRRGPVAGRERELARMRALWEGAGRDDRVAVLVTGEPGIGKTRLLAELAAALHDEGAVVLYGRAEEDDVVPYGALAGCLRDHAQFDVLARAAASITGSGASGARLRMFEEVAATLDAVASAGPLALLLDDLHWADPATARLLAYLTSRSGGAPRMLVGAYRETDLDDGHPLVATLAQLRQTLPVDHVALAGLDRDGVAAMIDNGRAGTENPDALRERTGGNPFFVQELLRAGPDAQLSDGVVDAVARRVRRLGANAHAVLVAAAVAGAHFDAALVGEVVGLTPAATLDILEAALRARLLAESPDEPARFAFAHALVREALIGPLTHARRARLHDLLAEALESRARENPDDYLIDLANHALEAAQGGGDPGRAVELAEQAAARAAAVFAHEDAAELMRRAVAMLERRGIGGVRRAQALCAYGEALERAGEPAAAAGHLERASELARIGGRPDLLARATLAAGGQGIAIVEVDPIRISRLEECLLALGPGHNELRVRLLARLAIELGYDARAPRRAESSQQALALARSGGSARALATALSARHVTLWGPDHTTERLNLANEMIELAYRCGDPELALQGRNWRIADLFEAGDGAGVRAELDAYAALATEVRLPTYSWWVPVWSATLALLDGRLAEGMELSRRARDLGHQAGDPNAAVITAQHELMRMSITEHFAEIDPMALGSGHLARQRAQRGPAWRAYRLTFSWLHAERGELDASRHHLDAALDGGLASLPRDANWLACMASATQACVPLRDLQLARGLREQLTPFADRIAVSARGACHGGSVAYLLARLAALCADTPAAERHFEHAAERDELAAAPVWVRRDLRRHAELLDALGEHARAHELRNRAATGASAESVVGTPRPRSTNGGPLWGELDRN